ncbi:LEM domain-containing protein 2-like [Pristis pectinata]|uniref:LEM domain-containing protein 2-like n=1 Tax=Pristis pectinata TaxID=685728 RepID=UPI00223DAFB3|nr:LEM domain-containing protein 2-like [Pristis pectinata]
MAPVMSDKELRRQLKSLGYSAGPITDSTRSLYVKKLSQLQSENRQKQRSGRTARSSQSTVDSSAAISQPVRQRPSAASAGARASTSGSWGCRLQDDQDSGLSADHPDADHAGTSDDDLADGGTSESVGARRTVSGADPFRGTSLYSDTSASLYSNPYTRTFDSLSSERRTRTSDNQYSDPYARIFNSLGSHKRNSLHSDRYKTQTDSLFSDRYTGKTDSPFSDRYTGKTDSPFSDRYTGKTDSPFSDRYTGKTDSPFSDRYTGKTDSPFSDRYTGKTDSPFSDRYTGKTDSPFSDRYTGKTDSPFSDRYTGKTDSPFSDRYTGKTDSPFSDRYKGKTDSPFSDRYTGKTDSSFSERYTVKTDSMNSDSCTGKYQVMSSDPFTRKSKSLCSDLYKGKLSDLYSGTRNSQGLYSNTRYRGRADSWSENEDESHVHRTSAGPAKNEKQKHKNRLVKFEFYLSWFLYIATIMLCLVLLALVCVKALGLVEGSQEDIDENIKMLPVDCDGKADTFCRAEEHKMIMMILTEVYEYLAELAGEFECGSESPLKSKCVPVTDVKTHLSILKVPNVDKFNEALQWIMQSPRDLGIRLVHEDPEAAVTSVDQVTCLESTRPQMNLYCRLQRAFFTILSRMLIFILVLSLLWITLLLLKYHSRKMEEQRQAMYEMVNKIIAVIRAHNEDWEKDLELVPYVPIPHVRDTLIQPKDRKKMKKIWQKAVQFLEASESRIRTEKCRINGQDFLVWRWIQPSSLCDSM